MANAARDEGAGGTFVFDKVAKFYISLFTVWTSILFLGVLYLFLNRNAQCVRIRNLPLSLSAVLCLHLFWSGGMFSYSVKNDFPCIAEYWIMNTLLPLGTALFQANNMLLLSVSSQQEKMLQPPRDSQHVLLKTRARSSLARRYWLRWKHTSLVGRTKLGIAVGMVVQVSSSAVYVQMDARNLISNVNLVQIILSLSVFLASRKFHPFGTMGQPVSQKECRRGVEW